MPNLENDLPRNSAEEKEKTFIHRFSNNPDLEYVAEQLYDAVRNGEIYGFTLSNGPAAPALLVRGLSTLSGRQAAIHYTDYAGRTGTGIYENDIHDRDDLVLKLWQFLSEHPNAIFAPCPEYHRLI